MKKIKNSTSTALYKITNALERYPNFVRNALLFFPLIIKLVDFTKNSIWLYIPLLVVLYILNAVGVLVQDKSKQMSKEKEKELTILYTELEAKNRYIDNLSKVNSYVNYFLKNLTNNVYLVSKNKTTLTKDDEYEFYGDICQACKMSVVEKKNFNNNDVTVDYLSIENSNKKRYIVERANSETGSNESTYFKIKKDINETKDKHFVAEKIFYDYLGNEKFQDKLENILFLDKEEIKNATENMMNSDMRNCNQYIGIPIACSNGKLSGLLEIKIKNDSYITKDRIQFEYFVSNYLDQFEVLISLVEKVCKVCR